MLFLHYHRILARYHDRLGHELGQVGVQGVGITVWIFQVVLNVWTPVTNPSPFVLP